MEAMVDALQNGNHQGGIDPLVKPQWRVDHPGQCR